jgi:general secretion pathway protein A
VPFIVDEAQNLDREVLEQLRLLSNLETETEKLLQIILLGQPELRETLDRPDLRQLSQRVAIRWQLDHLDRHETHKYVQHRLRVAGGDEKLFDAKALDLLHEHSGGIPRLINIIAHRAIWSGSPMGAAPGSRRVAAAVSSGESHPDQGSPRGWVYKAAAGAGRGGGGRVALLLVLPMRDDAPTALSAAVVARCQGAEAAKPEKLGRDAAFHRQRAVGVPSQCRGNRSEKRLRSATSSPPPASVARLSSCGPPPPAKNEMMANARYGGDRFASRAELPWRQAFARTAGHRRSACDRRVSGER